MQDPGIVIEIYLLAKMNKRKKNTSTKAAYARTERD